MTLREEARQVILQIWDSGEEVKDTHQDFSEGRRRKAWLTEFRSYRDKEEAGTWASFASRAQRRPIPKRMVRTSGIAEADQKFYREVWDARSDSNGIAHCEETGVPLTYSAKHVSHILSRGAHPELRHHPDNVNILCEDAHRQWEFGNRQSMKIWPKNKQTMITLLQSMI